MTSSSLALPTDYCITPILYPLLAFEAFEIRKRSEHDGIFYQSASKSSRTPLLDAILYPEEQDEQNYETAIMDAPKLWLDSLVMMRGGGGGGNSSPSFLVDDFHHPLAFVAPPVHHHSLPLHTTVAASSIQPPPDESCATSKASLGITNHDGSDNAPSSQAGTITLEKNTTTAMTQQDSTKAPRRFRWRLFRVGKQRTMAVVNETAIVAELKEQNEEDDDEVVPLRFMRAAKGNPVLAQKRYQATLEWRKKHHMDTILQEPHDHFEFIKQHYPHYFHLRGKNGEPAYFEMPPKTNLKALRKGGVTLDMLLRHYAMVTEFTWQCVSRDDLQQSIYVIDLEGIRPRDFAGECVTFVRKACAFCNQHYPERSGCIFVINVPVYFELIWRVVKKFADKKTLSKVKILRGEDDVLNGLLEVIDLESIPPEYGGTSMPLGEAPEEKLLWDLMRHNNHVALHGTEECGGKEGGCTYCSFEAARKY